MKRDRWENLEELFHAARELEAEKRSAFLDEACAGDPALRLRVERMLAEDSNEDSLLGKPVIDVVSAMLPADTPQTIPSGSLLEHYRILSVVGAGGMGTVYRARDLKLDRDVAIKVLPPEFTMDPERLSRFQREARILASLNHSNIGTIHGLTEGVGVRALVLELVEGPTLADRLQSGPIPAKEALMIARQVADALDAAHSSGVIHRDLKPANIKLRPDGTVKVLDFGIAKAGIRDGTGDNLTTSLPTRTVESTRLGVILGTPAYMSPEQARGQSLDKRADIWAFGCVLYEMLTGRRAFSGATITDIIAAILEREPDWQFWPAAIPTNVTRLVRRCLEKDPRQRLRDIADARFELSDQPDSGAISPTVLRPARSRWRTVLLAAAAAAISVIATWSLTPPPPPQPVRTSLISIAPATDFGRPATTGLTWSPDGRRLVFSASSQRLNGSGRETKLYLRRIDDLDAEPIEGTDGGSNPVFLPYGDAVAFRAGGKLKSVGFDGKPPVELASVSPSFSNVGLSWFSNGDVLFADYGRGLSRTQPNGKEPISVTKPKNGERHLFPVVLPGDQTIVFTIYPPSGWAKAKIVAQSLTDEHQQTLIEGGADARFIPPGYLVYMKSETLMAAQFDPKTLIVEQGVPMLEGVRVALNPETGGGNTSAGQFAVSNSGDLVYVDGGARPDPVSTPVWVNRDGEAQPINAPRRLYRSPRLSTDDKRFAYITLRKGARDIWVHDFLQPETPSRQTAQYENTSPVWSPDGMRLLFSSTENSYRNIFRTVVNGKTRPERLTTSGVESQDPMSWHGNYVLFTQRHEQRDSGTSRRAIMLLTVDEKRPPTPWMEPKGNYALRQAEFSPDGRYVAYSSNETGKWEVYVRPFQGDGPQIPVSIHGGTEPVWSSTGELFYRNGDKVIAADVRTTPVLEVRKLTELFKDIYETAGDRPSPNYDVTSDGRQFLMVKANPEAPEPPTAYITIVSNWIEEVQNRLSRPAK